MITICVPEKTKGISIIFQDFTTTSFSASCKTMNFYSKNNLLLKRNHTSKYGLVTYAQNSPAYNQPNQLVVFPTDFGKKA